MISSATSDDIAAKVRAVLESYPELSAVFVFGSAARGTMRRDSDVDIAFRGGPDHEPDEVRRKLHEWLGRLGVALERDAHLVDLRTAPPELRRRVYSEGVTVFDRDPDTTRMDHLRAVQSVVDWEFARRIRDEAQNRRLDATAHRHRGT